MRSENLSQWRSNLRAEAMPGVRVRRWISAPTRRGHLRRISAVVRFLQVMVGVAGYAAVRCSWRGAVVRVGGFSGFGLVSRSNMSRTCVQGFLGLRGTRTALSCGDVDSRVQNRLSAAERGLGGLRDPSNTQADLRDA